MFGALFGMAEALLGEDEPHNRRNRHGRRHGRRFDNNQQLHSHLAQTFGQMAFLPAQRVSKQDVQQGYRGGVNPIAPYQVAQPYQGGRVRGLFIGINYRGQKGELSGCINDVTMMLQTLEKVNFPLQEACVLVDDPNFRGCSGAPTRANIIQHFQWLVHDVRPGDVLFLHYSGHGSQTEDRDGDEDDGMDETLVPLDYTTAGTIVDDDIYEMLVARLPPGVRLTAVMDCCHSGSLMDLPFSFEANGRNMQQGSFQMAASKNINPNQPLPDVVLFSGCSDDQTSADVGNATTWGNANSHGKGNAGGACTNALANVLTRTSGLSYTQLLQEMRKMLTERRYTQVPQLSSSKPVAMNKPFSFFGSLEPVQNFQQPPHGNYPPQHQHQQQQGYPPHQQQYQQGYPPQQGYPQQQGYHHQHHQHQQQGYPPRQGAPHY